MRSLVLLTTLSAATALAQPQRVPQPESIRSGIELDLEGKTALARRQFQKAIAEAPDAQAKANAQRALAMSYAFDGDCEGTMRAEEPVYRYYGSTKNYFQQGEIADEIARVCIDAGNLDAAEKWYRMGHDDGLKEPNISPERADLWNFRWEHAQARLAARRGNRAEAEQHVAAAKALLDKDPQMAKQQQPFYPYLTGYVAYYAGEYKAALADFEKANTNDPFIQTMIGETYLKLGDKDKAHEFFEKALQSKAHNPPSAYAHRIARQHAK